MNKKTQGRLPKTSRNGLKVAKAGHKSEDHMGIMANSYVAERLRGGGHGG